MSIGFFFLSICMIDSFSYHQLISLQVHIQYPNCLQLYIYHLAFQLQEIVDYRNFSIGQTSRR